MLGLMAKRVQILLSIIVQFHIQDIKSVNKSNIKLYQNIWTRHGNSSASIEARLMLTLKTFSCGILVLTFHNPLQCQSNLQENHAVPLIKLWWFVSSRCKQPSRICILNERVCNVANVAGIFGWIVPIPQQESVNGKESMHLIVFICFEIYSCIFWHCLYWYPGMLNCWATTASFVKCHCIPKRWIELLMQWNIRQ